MRPWREWFTGSPVPFPLRNRIVHRVLAYSPLRLLFDVITLSVFTAFFLWVRFGHGAR